LSPSWGRSWRAWRRAESGPFASGPTRVSGASLKTRVEAGTRSLSPKLGTWNAQGMVLETDERILVDAAKGGDDSAFEVLVRRHGPRVYRIALRMLKSPEEAEEAAQEAWLAAWRALPRFRVESTLSTWLYRIVTNRCLALVATSRPSEPLDQRLPDPAPPTEERAELHARLEAVKEGILALTSEQRAALVLRELEGLHYEEIAAVLGVTVETVKGRVHRARASLWRSTRRWR